MPEWKISVNLVQRSTMNIYLCFICNLDSRKIGEIRIKTIISTCHNQFNLVYLIFSRSCIISSSIYSYLFIRSFMSVLHRNVLSFLQLHATIDHHRRKICTAINSLNFRKPPNFRFIIQNVTFRWNMYLRHVDTYFVVVVEARKTDLLSKRS